MRASLARLAIALAGSVALGCAHASLRTASPNKGGPTIPRAAAPARVDRVLELARALPRGLDRCVLLRPTRVPESRRALLAYLSQADALAFSSELGVTAYAEGARDGRAGRGEVQLLWLDAPEQRVRTVLAARFAGPIDWGDTPEACEPNRCPARARWLAPHLLRVERGVVRDASAEGAEVHCARMAEHSGAALELGFQRSRSLLSLALAVMPLTASSELVAGASGIHVRRVDLMRSSSDAEQVVGDPASADLVLGPIGALGSHVRREQEDAAVNTEYDVLWEDLELARDDEARLRAAEGEADALERQRPEPNAVPALREDVLAELGDRLERMREADGDARKSEAEAARALLERALARDPEDETAGLLLAELLLSELGQPGPARELVQRFVRLPGAQARWPELGRQAAALTGASALADALVADKLATRNDARSLAAAILARLREGANYPEAERAALAHRKDR